MAVFYPTSSSIKAMGLYPTQVAAWDFFIGVSRLDPGFRQQAGCIAPVIGNGLLPDGACWHEK